MSLVTMAALVPGSAGPHQLWAQTARKVYVSVDMEGISGISGMNQLSPGGSEYGRSRKLMAEDANAAIRGAVAAGATEVLVNDSHGGQRNLLPEDLHPAASLISHSFKTYGMMEGVDETFAAAIFVGYHAKADAHGLSRTRAAAWCATWRSTGGRWARGASTRCSPNGTACPSSSSPATTSPWRR